MLSPKGRAKPAVEARSFGVGPSEELPRSREVPDVRGEPRDAAAGRSPPGSPQSRGEGAAPMAWPAAASGLSFRSVKVKGSLQEFLSSEVK